MGEHPADRVLDENAAITFATSLAARGVIGETTPAEALELAELASAAKALGIGMRDFERILRHVETYTRKLQPAALEDLECAYRVGACMAGDEWLFNGTRIGQHKGRTVLYWPKGERRR